MPVAQIPCVHASLKHAPVVFFGISHEPGILLGGEEFVFGDAAVPMQVFKSPLLQILELPHHLFSTGLGKIEARRIAISLLVVSKMIETGIALASSPRRVGIELFQITDHLITRTIQ